VDDFQQHFPNKILKCIWRKIEGGTSGSTPPVFPGLFSSKVRQGFTSPKRENAVGPRAKIKAFHAQTFNQETPSTYSFLKAQNFSKLKISQRKCLRAILSNVINGIMSVIYKDAIGACPLGTMIRTLSHCGPCDLTHTIY
jgi:hypothetical protein